jgi:hypothetical protein
MSDFKELIYKDVTFVTNRLWTPHHWDNRAARKDSDEKGATVECGVNDINANWSIRFGLDKARATELFAAAENHFNARKDAGLKCGKFELVRGYIEDNENDRFIFTAKRNCKTSKGVEAKQPKIVDGKGIDLLDQRFASGSTGSIKFSMLPTNDPSKKNWGITMYVAAVQVKEAKYGGNELEGFDVDELEDEIPF